MSERRQLPHDQAIEALLAAVEEVLCSCLYQQDHQEEMLVGLHVLAALEDAYDACMSFRIEDATQEEPPHAAP